MSALAHAVFVTAMALPAPYAPPERAETAAVERAAFLHKLSDGLAEAAEEATCSGFWADSEDCRRVWPGPADELASLELTIGWWESKLDPVIQAGDCPVWGPAPTQITCDGQLFRNGVRPPLLRGVEHKTRWGLVVHTSVSVFQMKPATQHRVNEVVGLGEVSVLEASREAARMISGFRGNCRTSSWLECTITAYAGSLTFRQAPARAATYYKVLRDVRAGLTRSAG
jgi:hypothetical protein